MIRIITIIYCPQTDFDRSTRTNPSESKRIQANPSESKLIQAEDGASPEDEPG